MDLLSPFAAQHNILNAGCSTLNAERRPSRRPFALQTSAEHSKGGLRDSPA